jgi:lipopolysaccharide export system protein LptA
MPIAVTRLRRWFAVGAIAVTLMVAGAYFYARYRVRNALTEIPEKIGLEIQQSAQGFAVSKSEQGRTLFKVQASKAVQFKDGGRAELHDVNIILYGRDASRFDQIYGADFEYDPKSGDVTAKGDVQIDLEANPAGLTSADQTPPKELKNPIHLRTSGLVFNQKTGDAYTREKIEFTIPQAAGSAVGASYIGRTNVLTLESELRVVLHGRSPATVVAARGTITKTPRQVLLERPSVVRGSQSFAAEQATLFLDRDNTVERVLMSGGVHGESQGPSQMQVRSAQLELLLGGARHDTLRTAIVSGDVQVNTSGAQSMQGSAGRVTMTFAGKSLLAKVRAEENVELVQHQKTTLSAGPAGNAQEVAVSAPVMDFSVAKGRRLERAETSGAAQIEILQGAGSSQSQRTVVTAGKFEAKFDTLGRLATVHGAPDARITNSSPGQPDRVSTSDTLDVAFRSGGGIDSIVQQGNMAYVDGERKAWAGRARYTPADQMLALTGSPRVAEGGMATTARSMRMNRATGDAVAENEVKSTYSDLKPQPGGALLASSSPIHVTARSMTAHRTPAVATYTGDARLWQDANVVQAPTIEFDRDRRAVVARGDKAQKVSTVLVQTDKAGKSTPVAIMSSGLTYTDSERRAHYEGGVIVKAADLTITAKQMDVFLMASGQATGNMALTSQGQLDRMVAQGNIVITQAQRRADGDQLVYTASDDKFVLSGGPPSIFDAERGKITGDSLTFYRRDDRVLVEGRDSSPTVTQTRVAR